MKLHGGSATSCRPSVAVVREKQKHFGDGAAAGTAKAAAATMNKRDPAHDATHRNAAGAIVPEKTN